jgi:hypothetical protein
MLDAAFQLLREHPRPLFVLSAILVIPGVALGLVNSLVFGDLFSPTTDATQPLVALGRVFGVVLPALAVWTCWFMLAFGALVWGASTAYMEGRDADPGAALRAAWARAGTLIGAGLLTWLLLFVQFIAVGLVFGVALAILSAGAGFVFRALQSQAASGTIALVVGLAMFVLFGGAMLVLTGRYVALPAVIMHEPGGAQTTMRRARELARGSYRRIAGLLLLVAVLFVSLWLGTLALLAFGARSQTLAKVVASIVNVPLYALFGTITTVLYYDLRVRAEGLDIEMLAEELDAIPSDTPASPTPREVAP